MPKNRDETRIDMTACERLNRALNNTGESMPVRLAKGAEAAPGCATFAVASALRDGVAGSPTGKAVTAAYNRRVPEP